MQKSVALVSLAIASIFCFFAVTHVKVVPLRGFEPRINSQLSKNMKNNILLSLSPFAFGSSSGKLDVSPTNVSTTPDGFVDIHLTYTMQEPSACNWIGIYSPANSTNEQYLDWFYIDVSSKSLTHRIFNTRTTYEFRLFGCHTTTDLIATSETVTMNSKYPCQGHLSLTENDNEMRLKWVSSLVNNPVVYLALSSNDIKQNESVTVFPASKTTYSAREMCGSTAGTVDPRYYRDPGMIYDVVMKPLKPATQYFYVFGSPEAFSEIHSFTTQIPSKTPNKPIKFVVFGDEGISAFPGGVTTASNIDSEENLDLLLHVGDISYARGKGWIWDVWSNMISITARRTPYMISIGNHEYDHSDPVDGNPKNKDPSGVNGTGYHPSWGNMGDDSDGECSVPMAKRFTMPANGNGVYWYSFDFHSGHFIMLSSEHNATRGSVLYTWLKDDLSKVDRTKTPWLFVSIHRPLYMSENYYSDNVVAEHLRQELEDLFYKFKVDVLFAGHYHAYQRSCFLYQGKCTTDKAGSQKGILHLTVGTAGAALDTATWERADWSEYREHTDFGYGRGNLTDSKFCFQFVRNRDNKVIDNVCVNK